MSFTFDDVCNQCWTVLGFFGTNEYISPWNCTCKKETLSVDKSKQRLITHQCKCPVRTLKTTGRTVVYCNC